MTKREICERLIDLRDNMIHGQDSANSMGELSCVLSATGKLIRDLILDLAAPEDEAEKAHPGVIVPVDKKRHPIVCLECGSCVKEVAVNRYYCPKCDEFISDDTKREESVARPAPEDK